MDCKPAQRCELISFHSISKGTSGECGLRGGYHVYTNIHPGTVAQVCGAMRILRGVRIYEPCDVGVGIRVCKGI